MYILAGDVGGTKTILALYKDDKKMHEKIFYNNRYNSLAEIVKEFSFKKININKACFGISGPVKDEKCKTVYLSWPLDSKKLSKELSIERVCLINDLKAHAYGIQHLTENDFYILNKGMPIKNENSALIFPGTGLGQAMIYFDGKKQIPFASEGGHSDFAPRNKLEIDLFLFLKKKYKHVSYERVLSGDGLHNIYEFLIQDNTSSNILHEEIKKSSCPQKIILKYALNEKSKICKKALDIFMSIYGAEAGNVALKFFATSGIYLGGGFSPLITKNLKKGFFMKAFTDKGRFSSFMKSIPVMVVLNKKSALIGAFKYAQSKL